MPSATAYGVLSGLNLLGMVPAGWLADRVHRPLLLTVIYVVRAAAFVLLISIADNYPRLILFGPFDYVTVSFIADRLGLGVLGLAMGLLSTGRALGDAAGAWAGGALFGWSGDYRLLWIVSLAMALGAALLVATLADPQRARAPAPRTRFLQEIHQP